MHAGEIGGRGQLVTVCTSIRLRYLRDFLLKVGSRSFYPDIERTTIPFVESRYLLLIIYNNNLLYLYVKFKYGKIIYIYI